MQRIYERLIQQHFQYDSQMAFLSGPRQAGKTIIAKNYQKTFQYSKYLNWDNTVHRACLLAGHKCILENLPLNAALSTKPLIIFYEIHKYKNWKNFLKGYVDTYREVLQIMVTGSSKLNILRRGSDSLMGRYFLYRIHPFSLQNSIA